MCFILPEVWTRGGGAVADGIRLGGKMETDVRLANGRWQTHKRVASDKDAVVMEIQVGLNHNNEVLDWTGAACSAW